MDNIQRLEYVDIFRGIALFIMVFIQIFDYLSVSSIYTTKPYYVGIINSVTWVPPSLLFTFVSGMSVFLLVNKLRSKINLSKYKSFFKIFRRYGKYILLSLPFTLIMWNIGIFLGWEEAIQGIGLSAIFTALFLILFFKKIKITRLNYLFLIILIIIFAFLQSILPYIIDNSKYFVNFPRYIDLTNLSFFGVLGTMIINALFRGWFSIINLFPIMLGGVLFFWLTKNQASYKKLFTFSLSFLLFSIILHIFGDPINYYGRSFSLTFFAIGESSLICSLAYWLYDKSNNIFTRKILDFLKIFGFTAFFVYIAHYILILKVLEITGLKDLLPDIYAWIITVPFLLLIYLLAKYYYKIKFKLPKILQI